MSLLGSWRLLTTRERIGAVLILSFAGCGTVIGGAVAVAGWTWLRG